MFEELISKKELLQEFQISYGQLYRWKRKKLIPEDWFIKKSVSTGQETFFPRNKIITRISKILELKDDLSLDDLANQFTFNVNDIKLKRSYLIKNSIIPLNIMERFELIINIKNDIYEESRLFTLFLYVRLMESGFLNLEEINEITVCVFNNYSKLNDENKMLVIRRKLGVCFYYVIDNDLEIIIDESAVEITKFKIRDILEKINDLKLLI